MLVLGTAGTGKLWLVYALSNLLGDHIRRAAPTGMTAFPIGGSTLHSLLCLPVPGGKDLQGNSLKKLQARLAGLKYISIHELFMVSQVKMAWINRRLRQATGKTAGSLGGMSMLMTGNFEQLPPVGGRPLYTLDPKDQLNQEGFQAYRQFTEVFILDKVQRQDAAETGDVRQRGFIDFLPRARDGEPTQNDWNLLLERDLSRQTAETKVDFEDATRLFCANWEVSNYNGTKVRALRTPVVECAAKHNCATAKRAPADAASSSETVLFLAKGAKVMLTKNLWQ